MADEVIHSIDAPIHAEEDILNQGSFDGPFYNYINSTTLELDIQPHAIPPNPDDCEGLSYRWSPIYI